MAAAFSPIPELNLLKDFEVAMDGAWFSEGFELYKYKGPDPELLSAWLGLKAPLSRREQARVDRIIPFAQATGTGSFYALWRCDDRKDLSTLPVVFFGDEGDLDVVANGLRELFQLLTLDNEWLIIDDDRDGDDEEPSEGREEYLDWLERTFGLGEPEDPDAIMDAASEAYGQDFADWLQEISPYPVELS
ncbi:hypothetical protein ACH4OW_19395 [Streptomyces sp. NPDC017056]|uniref:hypothetical protein n=1 Tax=Streptomyces sp. NPDC017056 TaxID=3364973 RepID=UPI0037A8C1A3